MANKNFEVKHGLSVGGTERITSAGVGTFTDLNVTGTTTTIDTATLQVQDKNIVINYGSGDTSSTASGAGITIQDAVDASNDATLLWDASADEFDFSHTVTAPSLKSTGASTFDSTLTSTGLLLTENTSLYNVYATISYYSSTNGVYVNGAGNSGWLRLNASGVQNSRTAIDLYGSSGGDYIKIKAGNTDTMYIGAGAAGRVGIGTSGAAKPLHVYSSDNHPLRVESSDAYAGIEIKDNGSATLPPLHSVLSNDHIFYGGHASARPEVVRFGSDGKVAINQASLTENLTVNGTGAFSGKVTVMGSSVHGSFDFYNNGTSYLNGTTYVDDVLQVTGSASQIQLGFAGAGTQQANSEALSIITPASGGGQGIGLKRLDSNTDQGLGQITWSNNTQDGIAKLYVKTDGAVNKTAMVFQTAGATGGTVTEKMRIDNVGRITTPLQAYTASYNNASQSVSAVTWTDWAVNTDLEYNGTSMRTATSTFTFPIAGVYLVTGLISLDSVSATNYALARAVFSSHNDVEIGILEKISDNVYGYDFPLSFMVKAVAGETMKLQTFSGSGSHSVRGGASSHVEIMLMG